MKYIPKTIYLPSGGLAYPPTAYIRKIDAAFNFAELNPDSYDTRFEMIQSTVNFYCDLPASISQMFLYDIYYLYSYILTSDIINDVYLTRGAVCSNCGEVNRVSISAAEFDISFYDPFIPLDFENTFTSSHRIEVELNQRTVQDNLQFAALMAQEENELDVLSYLKIVVLFLVTQIKKINIVGKEAIEKKYWKDVLYSFISNDLFSLFEQALNYNKILGIFDKTKYVCTECGEKNYLWYFDDILDNRILVQKEANTEMMLNLIKGLISESRLPCFTINDVMERPIHFQELYGMAISDADFKMGSVML